jgi:hypothetical protein
LIRILNKVIIWSNITTNEKENIFLSLGLSQHRTFWKVNEKQLQRTFCFVTNRKLRHKQWDHKFPHISLDIVTNDKASIPCILGSYFGPTDGQ